MEMDYNQFYQINFIVYQFYQFYQFYLIVVCSSFKEPLNIFIFVFHEQFYVWAKVTLHLIVVCSSFKEPLNIFIFVFHEQFYVWAKVVSKYLSAVLTKTQQYPFDIALKIVGSKIEYL